MGKLHASLSVVMLLVALGLVCGHVGVEKRFQLVGFTTGTVMGDIGIFGMTQTCQAEFPGSRFCELDEVLRTLVIPQGLAGWAWVDSDGLLVDQRCKGWNSAEYNEGPAVAANGAFTLNGLYPAPYCADPHPVACCALVPVP